MASTAFLKARFLKALADAALDEADLPENDHLQCVPVTMRKVASRVALDFRQFTLSDAHHICKLKNKGLTAGTLGTQVLVDTVVALKVHRGLVKF